MCSEVHIEMSQKEASMSLTSQVPGVSGPTPDDALLLSSTHNGYEDSLNTNSIESTIKFRTVSPPSYNDSAESSFQDNARAHISELDIDIASESVECRVDKILELGKSGAQEEMRQKIIFVLKENDNLKVRLRQMKSYCDALQNVDDSLRTKSPETEFCIDTTASEFEDIPEGCKGSENERISYNLMEGGELLLPKSAAEVIHTGKSSSMKNCCFNCLGSHLITDCQEPRDHRRIFKNRRDFQSRQPVASSRYHVDEGQRFGHIRPGQQPSRALRKALGLKDSRCLPPYIYQMRRLGYPAAWLKHAQINRK